MITNPAQMPIAMELKTIIDRIRERQILRQATLRIMSAYFQWDLTS